MKNAPRDSRLWLELFINHNALSHVNPVPGPRLASPHALRVRQALPIQTRAPPASLSAYHALLAIIRQTKDNAHVLLVPLELGAVALVPSKPPLASRARPGHTILYQGQQT